jgi:hypothetical protein
MLKGGSIVFYNGLSWHAPGALVGFDSPPLHQVSTFELTLVTEEVRDTRKGRVGDIQWGR